MMTTNDFQIVGMTGDATEFHGFACSVGMTPDLLTELSRYQKFPKTAAELIRVAGLEAASRLISAWGGQEWPVPMRIGGANPAGVRRYTQLTRLVGEPAAQRIVNWWGGSKLMIPNLKEIKHVRTQRLIRAEYDYLVTKGGLSSPEAVFDLGVKFGLAGRSIENIIKRPEDELSSPSVMQ